MFFHNHKHYHQMQNNYSRKYCIYFGMNSAINTQNCGHFWLFRQATDSVFYSDKQPILWSWNEGHCASEDYRRNRE